MKFFAQPAVHYPRNGAAAHGDRAHLHPAAGVVCPRCGARVGRPCVSTVPLCGGGSTGTPIEGMHAERIAAALEASA